jgi:hypothetical protein
MKAAEILNRIVFVGGPPRSGTTFAAKSLNLHPGFVAAIDDHVYECWGLYCYRDKTGLVQELRTRRLTPEDAKNRLRNHLFADGRLVGAAPSLKTAGCPPVSTNRSPAPGSVRSVLDESLERYEIPLERFSRDWRLCLKSPEITHVLPQLASCFPGAQFVLVYRPVMEIAESMYRIGNLVKRFPVFHKRWIDEKGKSGQLIPPPVVPAEWDNLWRNASDFQRCVIYAAGYLRGLLEGTRGLSPSNYLIFNHAHLRNSPYQTFQQLARFLDVDASGFQTAVTQVQADVPSSRPELVEEYSSIEAALALKRLLRQIEFLISSHRSYQFVDRHS